MKGFATTIERAEKIAAFLRDRADQTPLPGRDIHQHFPVARSTFFHALAVAHDRRLIHIADYRVSRSTGGHRLPLYLAGDLPDAERPPIERPAAIKARHRARKAVERVQQQAPIRASIDPFSAALFGRSI